MKMQLINETFRYDVLNNETKLKMKILFKQNYLCHGNLQFKQIRNNFTICVTRMQDEDQTLMHPSQSLVGETVRHTVHTSQFFFYLHQPLISFLHMTPSFKQYWKDVQTSCKVWNRVYTEFDY